MNVQQLKNAILQEAIEGRLVPQDPNDEPASALLQRIRQEKERLVKEGKLKKKDLEVKPISEDEKPFEIPESWEWVRLVNIGIAETGTTPSKSHPEYFGTFIPFLGPANMLNGQIISETQGLSEIGANYGRIVPKGSILQVCIGGSIGKCAIVDKPVTFNQQINSITPLVCVIEYIYYVLQSDYFRLAIKEKSTGTATPIINRGNWEQLAVPLPPLDEQHRIVAKIEELLPKVEEYGKAQETLDKLNAELPERLKKSILQEAISGRLVPQDPNDEPASVLLEKIRKEKAQLLKAGKLKKKDLIETPINEDEIPFEIPDSWEWVRIGNLTNILNGFAFKSVNYTNEGIRVIRITNVQDGKIVDDDPKYYPLSEMDSIKKYLLKEGDLLMSLTGNVGRVGIIGSNLMPAALNQRVACLRLYIQDIQSYLYMYLLSEHFKSRCISSGKGMAQLNISTDWLGDYIIPLPPLAEQRRIVATLEQLLGEIDKLK